MYVNSLGFNFTLIKFVFHATDIFLVTDRDSVIQ